MKNALFRFIGLLVTASCIFAEEKSDLIINGSDWFDTEGRKISAHEGELARFGDYFYWYGSSYKNNPQGKFRMVFSRSPPAFDRRYGPRIFDLSRSSAAPVEP